jgi:hypothetical protein
MPTPETSKVIEELERSKVLVILNEILNAGAKTLKQY